MLKAVCRATTAPMKMEMMATMPRESTPRKLISTKSCFQNTLALSGFLSTCPIRIK